MHSPDPSPTPLPGTRWELISDSAAPDPAKRLEAWGHFYGAYLPPLFHHVWRRGFDVETARDLTQSFFVHLIETEALAAASPAKGRFRTFLLALLDHYLADECKRARRQKRGGGAAHLSFDDPALVELARLAAPGRRPGQDSPVDRAWNRALFQRALSHVGEEYRRSGRLFLFVALRAHLYGLENPQVYARLSRHLDRPRATLRSDFRRLRMRHLELLRAELRVALGPLPRHEERAFLRQIIRSGTL